jgi:hypothetical protein
LVALHATTLEMILIYHRYPPLSLFFLYVVSSNKIRKSVKLLWTLILGRDFNILNWLLRWLTCLNCVSFGFSSQIRTLRSLRSWDIAHTALYCGAFNRSCLFVQLLEVNGLEKMMISKGLDSVFWIFQASAQTFERIENQQLLD